MPPKKKKTGFKKEKAPSATLPLPHLPLLTRRSLSQPTEPAAPLLSLKLKLLQGAPHVPSSFDLILPVTTTLATLLSHLQTRHGLMKNLALYTSQYPPTALSLLDAAHTTLEKCLSLTAPAAGGVVTPIQAMTTRKVPVTMPGSNQEMMLPALFLYYDFQPAVDGPLLRYEPRWC
eukprot:evm.model.NODE_23468_length_5021_cov_9.969528.2